MMMTHTMMPQATTGDDWYYCRNDDYYYYDDDDDDDYRCTYSEDDDEPAESVEQIKADIKDLQADCNLSYAQLKKDWEDRYCEMVDFMLPVLNVELANENFEATQKFLDAAADVARRRTTYLTAAGLRICAEMDEEQKKLQEAMDDATYA